jgi:hypothetical protein
VGFSSAAGEGTGLATFEGGSATETSGPTAKSNRTIIFSPGGVQISAVVALLVRSKSHADILAAAGLKFLARQPAPIYEIGSSITARFTVHHNEHVSSQFFEAGRRHSLQGYRLTQPVVQMMLPLSGSTAQ